MTPEELYQRRALERQQAQGRGGVRGGHRCCYWHRRHGDGYRGSAPSESQNPFLQICPRLILPLGM